MPKRYGKRETWRRKTRARLCPPGLVLFLRAMYNPFFGRVVLAWRSCHGVGTGWPAAFEWADAAEYCLDRPDVI